jgi:hypothetical protein
MSRVRQDGERLEWKVAIPLSNELPFLIDDVTPRAVIKEDGPTGSDAQGAKPFVLTEC